MSKNYTYKEALELSGLKRSTFYNRLNKYQNLYRNHFITKSGQKYISEEGLEIIKNGDLDLEEESEPELVIVQPKNLPEDNSILILQERIKQMTEASIFQQKQLEFLQEQLREKDNQMKEKDNQMKEKDGQIREKDNQLNRLASLVENGQVLLKNEQERKIIPEKFEDVIQESEETIAPAPMAKKWGFIDKFFGK